MKFAYVGPRGWAVLTLAAGTLVATPFLRNSQQLLQPSSTVKRLATDEVSARFADSVESFTVPEIAAIGRILSGELPSTELRTSVTSKSLPEWAVPASQLDRLIVDGPASSVRTEHNFSIDSMHAWVNPEQESRFDLTKSQSHEARGLAYRSSPWDTTDRRKPVGSKRQTRPSVDSQRWQGPPLATDPHDHVDPTRLLRSSGTIGNLVKNASRGAGQDNSPVRAQATISSAPRGHRFVFQPRLRKESSPPMASQ